MIESSQPGDSGDESGRAPSAFELLGLLPTASPTPLPGPPASPAPTVAPPESWHIEPVSIVPIPTQLPIAAPLSRREARELAERTERPTAASRRSVRPDRPRRGRTQPAATRPAPPSAKLGRRTPSRPANRPTAAARPARKSIGKRLMSLGAMVFAGALLVGLTVPANAFYGPGSLLDTTQVLSAEAVQTLEVDDAVATDAANRSGWGVTSWAEILRQQYGSANYSYTVGNGAIRWPFAFPVPISDGYGDRVSPCRGCSSYHQGIDFIPGSGQPIYVIADGVVTLHEESNWSYGNTVEIEHQIDGQVVTSKYAHMQYGSSALQVGDVVEVGDFMGLVGDTGASTGPHLHFEIWIDGVKVNPFTWLTAKAS